MIAAFLLGAGATGSTGAMAASAEPGWSELEPLPDPVGLKGMYGGVSNGRILLAGGSNFPVPPRAGGRKTFHRAILSRPVPLAAAAQPWERAGELPEPLGEGAAVITPDGVVCVGGHDGSAPAARVFVLRWNPQRRAVEIQPLPDLPAGIANGAAAIFDGWIYLAGGEGPSGALGGFLRLELAPALADPKAVRWEMLPGWPGRPRLGAVISPVETGGGVRLLVGGGVHGPARSGDDYLRDAFLFDPGTRRWTAAAPLPRPAVLPAVLRPGPAHVAVLGGSDGHDFARMRELGAEYRIPGDSFLYDGRAGRWSPGPPMPIGLVAAAVVPLGAEALLAGGEYSPGLRTARCFTVRLATLAPPRVD